MRPLAWLTGYLLAALAWLLWRGVFRALHYRTTWVALWITVAWVVWEISGGASMPLNGLRFILTGLKL